MLKTGLQLILLFLILIAQTQGLLKTGALRMCDADDCELTVKLVSSVYQFSVYNSILLTNNYMALCVRQRVIGQL